MHAAHRHTSAQSHVQVSLLVAGVVAAALGVATVAGERHGHQLVRADELQWVAPDSLPAGARMTVIEGAMAEPRPFTARIHFPADYRLPAHTHPAVERVTVLEGTVHMGMGDELDPDRGVALSPGDMMIIQPGQAHFLFTGSEEVIVQLNGIGPWGITYIDPNDDPRNRTQ